jgi:SOS regulatory protein LexA
MHPDQQYLGKLQDYYARNKVLPSYATIASLMGLSSKSSVASMVARLKLAGFLKSLPDKRLSPTKRFFERALAVATVRAGLPERTEAESGEAMSLDDYLIERPSQAVLIKVKGDSMQDAGILDGDVAVVQKQAAASKGDIVVAIVDNEFTLKRLDFEKGKPVLRAENKAYAPIRPQGELEIFGVMVGLVRKLQ